MFDIWLKFTGTKAQARTALVTLNLDDLLLYRDEQGTIQLRETGGNEHVCVQFFPNLITAFGTYHLDGIENASVVTDVPAVLSGPHLLIRFISRAAALRARTKIVNAGGLPAGVQRVSAPTTLQWYGGYIDPVDSSD